MDARRELSTRGLPHSNAVSLTSPALAAIHAERRESSEVNTLVDSDSALTALHLLSKFIRMNRNKLDSATKKGLKDAGLLPAPTTATTTTTTDEPEAAPLVPVPVGKGVQLGADKHKHKHKADSQTHQQHDHEHHAGDTHDEAFLLAAQTQGTDLYHSIWHNISAVWATDILSPEHHHTLSADVQERHRQCSEWIRDYTVLIDINWGNMPAHLHAKFDELKCSDLMSLDKVAQFVQEHPAEYSRQVSVSADRQIVKAEPGMEDKVIATVACVTTRSLHISGPEDLALFKDLLPSFAATVEEGFEYWFYIGYDLGDPWFDNAEHLQLAREFFQKWVTAPLAKKKIVAKLVLATWNNTYHKPGPAFNYVTAVAYQDGATYIYRINDDQRFETPWAHLFVDALQAMGPPYGVVGPACAQGATHILVVDFTHRMHHEIFLTHYPHSLLSWFMDNWISQVYGQKRTKRITEARITHLTGSHGTRYTGQTRNITPQPTESVHRKGMTLSLLLTSVLLLLWC